MFTRDELLAAANAARRLPKGLGGHWGFGPLKTKSSLDVAWNYELISEYGSPEAVIASMRMGKPVNDALDSPEQIALSKEIEAREEQRKLFGNRCSHYQVEEMDNEFLKDTLDDLSFSDILEEIFREIDSDFAQIGYNYTDILDSNPEEAAYVFERWADSPKKNKY